MEERQIYEKSLFAVAGVATLAAVAMPVAGVLADTMTVKDSLTVTVGSSCTLASIMSKKRMRLAIYIIYIAVLGLIPVMKAMAIEGFLLSGKIAGGFHS